jgi:hypothetical protein
MSNPTSSGSEIARHWVVVRHEPSGRFSAQVVGIPDLRADASSREETIDKVHDRIREWLTSGKLVAGDVPCANPLPNFSGHLDPDDPVEKEFVEELARLRREDQERKFREYDQECSNSSSIPTT